MFTGLIQDVGKIRRAEQRHGNLMLSIVTEKLFSQLRLGESVSVAGVCLTVTDLDESPREFAVAAVAETLAKSTLGTVRGGDFVNLELALRSSDRLGGHFVQGHVDTVGTVRAITAQSGSWLINIGYPREFRRFLVEKGAIAVDGVSLTAIGVREAEFQISVIPHTWNNTTLPRLKVGARVNLEFDLLGKYVVAAQPSATSSLTADRLREYGY